MKAIIAVSTVVLSLAAGVARPQTPTPQPKLVAATGVGGCIYRSLPEAVTRDAVSAILSHTGLVQVLRGPIAAVAPKCTGRPFSDSDPDPAVVGSVMSVYARIVSGYSLASQLQVPESRLYDAWVAATAEEKAPFVASAQSFLQRGAIFAAAKPEAADPFVRRLGITATTPPPTLPKVVHMYYSAMALNELAEADLAAKGASPAQNR